jgi:hypothetical protein
MSSKKQNTHVVLMRPFCELLRKPKNFRRAMKWLEDLFAAHPNTIIIWRKNHEKLRLNPWAQLVDHLSFENIHLIMNVSSLLIKIKGLQEILDGQVFLKRLVTSFRTSYAIEFILWLLKHGNTWFSYPHFCDLFFYCTPEQRGTLTQLTKNRTETIYKELNTFISIPELVAIVYAYDFVNVVQL